MPVPTFEVPTPLDYFSALVAEDESFSVLEAAIALSQAEVPGLDAQTVLADIDTLAARLAARLPADAGSLHRLRLLNSFFFQELGFAGNLNDYHDRRNSNLAEVLRTRRGIPITLALIYIELATQIGLRAVGVSFPGHFLVKLHLPEGEVVLDPFSGRSLSRGDLDERLAPYLQQRGLTGDFEVPLPLFLQAATPRETIARMLHNLKSIHHEAGDAPRLLAVLDRLVILLPEAWEERRDRAFVQAELGHADLAAEDMALYLAHRPASASNEGGADLDWLQQRLAQWQAQAARPLS